MKKKQEHNFFPLGMFFYHKYLLLLLLLQHISFDVVDEAPSFVHLKSVNVGTYNQDTRNFKT